MRASKLLMAAMFGLGISLVVMVPPAEAKRDTKAAVSKSGREDKKPNMSERFYKRYEKVSALYEEQKYDEALTAAEELMGAAKSGYEKAKVLELKAFVRYDQDDIEGAIASFNEAIATDALPNADHFQAKLTVAELYNINNQPQESITAFEDWLKDAEAVKARNYAMMANNFYDLEDYENVVKYVDLAFSTGEEVQKSWFQMKANALYSLERFDDALAFAREAVAKNPGDPEFANFLTGTLLEAERPQEAVDFLNGLRAQGQLTTEAQYNNLYIAYRDLDKPKDAAMAMQEGIEKGVVKSTRERLLMVGEAYYDAEDLPNALTQFQKAADASPDNGTADLYVGQVLLDQEKPKEARDYLVKAVQKGNLRQTGNAYYQLGIAEMDSGNEAAAIAAFEKAKGYPESEKNAVQALKSLGR